MRLIIYVEGKSDELALTALLSPLLDKKEREGKTVHFFSVPEPENKGHNKRALLTSMPRKAVNIIKNDPNSFVVIMPDLYPRNIAFPHETFDELKTGIIQAFNNAVIEKGYTFTTGQYNRFSVFCLKHDLEALILASHQHLASYLNKQNIPITWRIPAEEQNHDAPPCRIVEKIFRDVQKTYKNTVDAPIILGNTLYTDLLAECNQCFKPFVDFLDNFGNI